MEAKYNCPNKEYSFGCEVLTTATVKTFVVGGITSCVPAASRALLLPASGWFLRELPFDYEVSGNILLRNVGWLPADYTASYSRSQNTSRTILYISKKIWNRLRCRCENNIKMELKEYGDKGWTKFIWIRTGSIGGILWRRWYNLGFHKGPEIYVMAERILASQEGLYCMELVSHFVHHKYNNTGTEARHPR